MRSNLSVRYSILKHYFTLTLSGELDDHSVSLLFSHFTTQFEKTGLNNVILDLTNITFVDSIGLGGVLKIYKCLLKKNGHLHLVSQKPQVETLLTISGLLKKRKTFRLFKTLDDAKIF